MTKEDQIIEMIGEAAIQATQQILESEARLERRIDEKIDGLRDELRNEMHSMQQDNTMFFDMIIGYLKRAEDEREFTSEHLRRHDGEILELQRVTGLR